MAGQNPENIIQIATLDKEWVDLVVIARGLGISKETVREFLTLNSLGSSPLKYNKNSK